MQTTYLWYYFSHIIIPLFFFKCFPNILLLETFENYISLRKHAYSNILNILSPKKKKKKKKWKFSDKNSYILHISAQNIDCGYSLEPPRQIQSRDRSSERDSPCRGMAFKRSWWWLHFFLEWTLEWRSARSKSRIRRQVAPCQQALRTSKRHKWPPDDAET